MDKTIVIKITSDMHGKTIKQILSNYGLSSSVIKQLKRTENGILLNGIRVYVNKCVNDKDELVLNLADTCSENIPPFQLELEVLHEDEDIIALNKPRGIPTHPSLNHYTDTLANALMYYFGGKDFTFRAITRLDRDTSGIVLVAKNPFSAQILNDEIKNRKIAKEYIAVVNGCPESESGVIDAPIKRLKESVILRGVSPDGKEAVTHYKVEQSNGILSLVSLCPITGRTHQLRVHMSYIGNPIYGDDLYGAPQLDSPILLHCRRIAFVHPISKEEIIIEAPVPEDIKNLLNKF